MAESNIKLVVSNDFAFPFAKVGYGEIFGTRLLKRVIEEKLVDEGESGVIEVKIKLGDTIAPRVINGRIELDDRAKKM